MKKVLKMLLGIGLLLLFVVGCSSNENKDDNDEIEAAIQDQPLVVEFIEGDVQDIEGAILRLENHLYGNVENHLNREIFIQLVDENYDFDGLPCYLFETYEIWENEKNVLTEYKVPHDANNTNDCYQSTINEPIERPEDLRNDEKLSKAMDLAEEFLLKKYSSREISIGYSGYGQHCIYLDGIMYYEIEMIDAASERFMGYILVSLDTDEILLRREVGKYEKFN